MTGDIFVQLQNTTFFFVCLFFLLMCKFASYMKTHTHTQIYSKKNKGQAFTGTILSNCFTFATHPATIYTYC